MIDLGCGLPDYSVVPRALAQLFEARSYIGVDDYPSFKNEIRNNEFSKEEFQSTFVKSDINDFLKSWTRKGPQAFLLEGIEVDAKTDQGRRDKTTDYLRSLLAEISKKSAPGDILIVGFVVSYMHPQSDMDDSYSGPTIDPTDFGFTRIKTSPLTGTVNSAGVNGRHDLWMKN